MSVKQSTAETTARVAEYAADTKDQLNNRRSMPLAMAGAVAVAAAVAVATVLRRRR
ncbi:hypothetical protein [Actinoplanes solisilvae]|uniref:hypothetical protein n=1 Tax=Actinoplanes solisilvae TaxID=2486853 RepID=UPI0013E392BA|nr:hypothetical protein [Actinoplanes solisilvae]